MAAKQDFVEQVRQANAGRTGTTSSVWESLMRQGVIAELHIGRPRFEQRLELEDLGIAPRSDKERKAIAAQVRPGVKLLLPPEYDVAFRNIESAARHMLGRRTSKAGQGKIYAFETPFGSFVPVTSFDDFMTKQNEYKARYFDKQRDLIKNYDAVRAEVLKEYARVAHGAYDRLSSSERGGVSRLTFIRRYVARIREGFPTTADIRNRFVFSLQLSLITLPDDVRKRIVAEEIATAEEKQRLRRLNEMRQAVAKSTVTAADEFAKVIDQQLYTLVYEVAAQARESLKKSQTMPSKTLVQLSNLVKQVQSLNFVGHKDLLGWAESVSEAVNGYRAASRRGKSSAYDSLVGTLNTTFIESQRRLSEVGSAVRHERFRSEDDSLEDYAELRTRTNRKSSSDDDGFGGGSGDRVRTKRRVI